jgi:hypothetical protein
LSVVVVAKIATEFTPDFLKLLQEKGVRSR